MRAYIMIAIYGNNAIVTRIYSHLTEGNKMMTRRVNRGNEVKNGCLWRDYYVNV